MKKKVLIKNNIRGEQWYSFIESERKHISLSAITELCVDFSEVSFIEPAQLVSIACLIELAIKQNAKITFIESKTYHVDKYLRDIRFYEYWVDGINRQFFTPSGKSSTFNLWNVRKEYIDNYAFEAKKYFQNTDLINKNLDPLHISLTEVFNNIFDHSESEISGYVFAQYFPKLEKITISVCDFGVGIPTKINRFWVDQNKDVMSDDFALLAATKRKVTSKSTPQNRGYGLANITDFVRNHNGEFEIRSNYGILTAKQGDIKSYLSKHNFTGTNIIISFYKRYLPDIEEVFDNEEFYL